ncbi:phosphodiester glycosidase family protein [Marivita sp.]|uniref:phosphodiester glycosidase family protein n=1 Tax=Marivita sp. TaxID=2003365 RepID=UPI00260E66F0|nr:phosphodiester glycosidase family protein [Marivita sp.]
MQADVTCAERAFDGLTYTACEVDPRVDDLRLFLDASSGEKYGQFSAIDGALAEQGKTLIFGMNAGMYHDDRSPVGHYVEDGTEIMRVIPNAGPGNFGLLPNGIFCIGDGRADVIETLAYEAERPNCRYATQSGPMLVIDGDLHPRFLEDSDSRYIRNGVGTSEDGTRVVFVISDQSVTFHEFGRIFRDDLDLPNALFLDGSVSRLHAPQLNRSDFGRWLGPIVGVVAPLDR